MFTLCAGGCLLLQCGDVERNPGPKMSKKDQKNSRINLIRKEDPPRHSAASTSTVSASDSAFINISRSNNTSLGSSLSIAANITPVLQKPIPSGSKHTPSEFTHASKSQRVSSSYPNLTSKTIAILYQHITGIECMTVGYKSHFLKRYPCWVTLGKLG